MNFLGKVWWAGGYEGWVYKGEYPQIPNSKVVKTTDPEYNILLFKR